MTTPAELFEKMPSAVDASKLGDLNATLVFDLSGDNGGQWSVAVANGELNVTEGATADATATVNMDATDYVNMVTGKANPVQLFMGGKVKVDGDLGTVMKMQGAFGM